MSDQCTCTTDKEATCIVHPTTRSLKARIAELEAELDALREAVGEPMNPCGECHLKPGETCDVCGAVDPRSQIDYGLRRSSDE